MIFVDASAFLRHLVQPVTPQDRINARSAAAMFKDAEDGQAEITTSEAILAEVVFILSHQRHYNTPRPVVATGLKTLLRAKGCKLPAKDVCLRALDLWVAHPKLSFPDALGAAYSERRGYELATIDVARKRVPGITAHAFSVGSGSA